MNNDATLAYNPLPYELDSTYGQFVSLMRAMGAAAHEAQVAINTIENLILFGPRSGWTSDLMLGPLPKGRQKHALLSI